jgi:hypothetical protein
MACIVLLCFCCCLVLQIIWAWLTPTSDYADLDIHPFWGDIQTTPGQILSIIRRSFTVLQAPCKALFQHFFLALLQTPDPPSSTSAQRWAVSEVVPMQQVPVDALAAIGRRLDQARVPTSQRPDYYKWLRFYHDFCHKYGHSPLLPTSLGPFLTKLLAKNLSVAQRIQAGCRR